MITRSGRVVKVADKIIYSGCDRGPNRGVGTLETPTTVVCYTNRVCILKYPSPPQTALPSSTSTHERPLAMSIINRTVSYCETSRKVVLKISRTSTVGEVKQKAVREMEGHMATFVTGIELELSFTAFCPGWVVGTCSCPLSLTRCRVHRQQAICKLELH